MASIEGRPLPNPRRCPMRDLADDFNPEWHDHELEGDMFPLVEETSDPRELPTVEQWLAAGAPMRVELPKPQVRGWSKFWATLEVDPPDDQEQP
jgi:hypothetical protein